MSFLSGAPQVLPVDNIDGLPEKPRPGGVLVRAKEMKGDSHARTFGWCCSDGFRRHANPCGVLHRQEPTTKRCRIVEERPRTWWG